MNNTFKMILEVSTAKSTVSILNGVTEPTGTGFMFDRQIDQ